MLLNAVEAMVANRSPRTDSSLPSRRDLGELQDQRDRRTLAPPRPIPGRCNRTACPGP